MFKCEIIVAEQNVSLWHRFSLMCVYILLVFSIHSFLVFRLPSPNSRHIRKPYGVQTYFNAFKKKKTEQNEHIRHYLWSCDADFFFFSKEKHFMEKKTRL